MASPSELTLECKPKSYATLLKSFGDQAEHQKLEEILSHLEEERLKIDGFKRELPLCMQLLNNAVEASRQQLESFQMNQGSRPVLEEFMPLKNPNSEGADRTPNMSEKANWMTSAQLWSQANEGNKHQGTVTSSVKETDHGFSISPKLSLDNKQRNGGAFLPFSKERSTGANSPIRALPDLALSSIDKEPEEKKCSESEKGMNCSRRDSTCTKGSSGGAIVEQGKGAAMTTEGQPTSTTTAQTHRKARRCWSPDLHRRFVNALQMLGGSQVATPKQIRELMKVDGLTNDEVKSHLQKYRLHTRRPCPAPQPSNSPTPQLVVLGGIWVPPEYATAAAAHGAAPAIYGTHSVSHASTHYCAQPPVVQDFYPAPPHALHPNLHHAYKASSQVHSSPESDFRRPGDRSESIEEDGKSESSSWKGDSGDNERGGPKGLLSLRDDGEESNGSEITLKF
ncbi:myb family transcription factor EFM-like [Aristolochia californica]|uniref:myb family transcription factor EFM-like n=1 Tax=Aristolochia californica TaxID=171875 RepID=UPI0035DA0FBF